MRDPESLASILPVVISKTGYSSVCFLFLGTNPQYYNGRNLITWYNTSHGQQVGSIPRLQRVEKTEPTIFINWRHYLTTWWGMKETEIEIACNIRSLKSHSKKKNKFKFNLENEDGKEIGRKFCIWSDFYRSP